ncbi:hypothetical protein JOM56_005145 [Amanita muscaria]
MQNGQELQETDVALTGIPLPDPRTCRPQKILALVKEAGTRMFEERKDKAKTRKTMSKKEVHVQEIMSILEEESDKIITCSISIINCRMFKRRTRQRKGRQAQVMKRRNRYKTFKVAKTRRTYRCANVQGTLNAQGMQGAQDTQCVPGTQNAQGLQETAV